jgi:formamidopyrimidine-DNA glycosylase
MLYFDNEMVLEIKAKLYGFFLLGKMEDLMSENQYFREAIHSIGVLDKDFSYEYFIHSTKMNQDKGSIKEALATDQHLPGIGNGTIQDILFEAKIRPERKISTLNEDDKKEIYKVLVQKVKTIFEHGGRDNTTDLFGRSGGYKVLMNSSSSSCPSCNTELVKKAYLGGKVIYCPSCQK